MNTRKLRRHRRELADAVGLEQRKGAQNDNGRAHALGQSATDVDAEQRDPRLFGGAMTTAERAERSGVSASHSGYHGISGACEVG